MATRTKNARTDRALPLDTRRLLEEIERVLDVDLVVGDRDGEIVHGATRLSEIAKFVDDRDEYRGRVVEAPATEWANGMDSTERDEARHPVVIAVARRAPEPSTALDADLPGPLVYGTRRDIYQFVSVLRWKRYEHKKHIDAGKIAVFDKRRFEALFVKNRLTRPDAVDDEERPPEGWSKHVPDPMRLLAGYPHLRIRPGLVLRAYQYHSGGNGHAVVWAMPADAPYPEPEACERVEEPFDAPRPPTALPRFMDAIEGDDTAEAYVSASIFERECAEIGAMWHGASWSTHDILFADPFRQDEKGRSELYMSARLSWLEPQPETWEPVFERVRGGAVVTFHTFSGHVREAIYRHVDRFKRGSFGSKTDVVCLAEGQAGYIF